MPTHDNQVAFAGHALAVYDELEKRAEHKENGEVVFTGKLTSVFAYHGVSTSLYSRVRRVLIESGSITIVERGRSGRPSVIRLHGAPSPEILSEKDLTLNRDSARLVLQLEKRVSALEARLPLNVTEALREHEVRIANLAASRKNGSEQTERTEPDG